MSRLNSSPHFSAGIISRWKNGRLKFLVVDDDGKFKFPGGKAEELSSGEWEDEVETLFREIEEETGMMVLNHSLVHQQEKGETCSPHTQYFFIVEAYMGESEGSHRSMWLDQDEMKKILWSTHLPAMRKALEALSLRIQGISC
jgi:hypothetical protein